jgi:hypothetical protein
MDVTFSSNDEDSSLSMECNSIDWTGQADTFLLFLLAQGFIVSEKMLSRYFEEKAKEIKDLRSNAYEGLDPFNFS